MDIQNPGTTNPVTTPQGSTNGSPTVQPVGVSNDADATVQLTEGSQGVQPAVEPVQPVGEDGQPIQPAAPVAPPEEPPVDPLENVFNADAGKKNVDIGKLDFEKAANTHIKELSESLSQGDPQLIEKLGKLKPKMLAKVVADLGKKFTIGEENAEFSTFEELKALLGNTDSHGEQDGDDVSTKNLKSAIDVKFLTALQTKGITFEDFKKTPQYVEVAQKAADKIAWMKKRGIPLSDFDEIFDFNLHFNGVMRNFDAKKAVMDAQAAQQKIASANQGNPITAPAPLAGINVPAAQGGKTYQNKLPESSFWVMTREQRLAYQKDWTDKSGTIQFAK